MLKQKINSFVRDTQGTFAINFALMSSMLLLGVGVAVDYSSLVSERTKMQDWTDSVVIAAALSGHKQPRELRKFVREYLKETNYADADFDLSIENGNVVLTLSKDQDLFLMGMFGADNKTVAATAAVPLGGAAGNVNIALVLDTTLSMEGNRLSSLKSAATDMLTDLSKDGPSGAMVSLVPFSDYVRISPSNKGQNWLDYPADETRTVQTPAEGSKCVVVQETSEKRKTVCPPGTVYVPRVDNNTWEGCMGSRRFGYHKTADFDGQRLPGFWKNGNCRESWNNEVLPLTKDITAVKTAVDDLFARGSTYVPAGLVWGWRTLSPNAPFVEAKKNPNASNVMIVMTDGSNSVSLRGETNHMDGIFHYGEATEAGSKGVADILTGELCTSIKSAGIEIYTITYEVTDNSTKSLFQKCASSSAHYYDAKNGNSLSKSFEDIVKNFSDIRLVR